MELAIALIVAPRTPSERFLPRYSEAVEKAVYGAPNHYRANGDEYDWYDETHS